MSERDLGGGGEVGRKGSTYVRSSWTLSPDGWMYVCIYVHTQMHSRFFRPSHP